MCNWMPLPYTVLANSISSNYSVLVRCNVPANNLKCAGGGCARCLLCSLSICMHLVVATWCDGSDTAYNEDNDRGQGCTSASSIYHQDDDFSFFFFLHSLFLLFFWRRQGKGLHYALGWYKTPVKYMKINYPQCFRRDISPRLSFPLSHPPLINPEQLNVSQFVGDSFWLRRAHFFSWLLSTKISLKKCILYSFRDCDR